MPIEPAIKRISSGAYQVREPFSGKIIGYVVKRTKESKLIDKWLVKTMLSSKTLRAGGNTIAQAALRLYQDRRTREDRQDQRCLCALADYQVPIDADTIASESGEHTGESSTFCTPAAARAGLARLITLDLVREVTSDEFADRKGMKGKLWVITLSGLELIDKDREDIDES